MIVKQQKYWPVLTWFSMMYEMLDENHKTILCHPARRISHTDTANWTVADEMVMEFHLRKHKHWWNAVSTHTHSQLYSDEGYSFTRGQCADLFHTFP